MGENMVPSKVVLAGVSGGSSATNDDLTATALLGVAVNIRSVKLDAIESKCQSFNV